MSTGSGQVGTGIPQGVRSTSGGEDLDSGISVGASLSENFNNGETCGGEHLWWGASVVGSTWAGASRKGWTVSEL